jgi:hypothetical protein
MVAVQASAGCWLAVVAGIFAAGYYSRDVFGSTCPVSHSQLKDVAPEVCVAQKRLTSESTLVSARALRARQVAPLLYEPPRGHGEVAVPSTVNDVRGAVHNLQIGGCPCARLQQFMCCAVTLLLMMMCELDAMQFASTCL